ncbi:MAG: DUF695 domain-containing protein [Desulfovibrio sp.]|jgi:hypothetical protein|nr:DUF695 domain-containing protein [Desulfovibrio sp.]
MTDNWDSYLCEVEGKPASILVDIGAVSLAPVLRLPYLAYVAISVANPDENGFPHGEEFDNLSFLEDALEDALTADETSVHIGRCITNGHYELVFYAAEPAGWNNRVAAIMERHPSCAWEADTRYEPGWDSYLGFLFPGEQDLLIIQNRRLCRLLREQGDLPGKIRPIRHRLDFFDPAAGRTFCRAARKLGFHTEETGAHAAQEGPGADTEESAAEGEADLIRLALNRLGAGLPTFRIYLTRMDTIENIDEISLSLMDSAAEHDGEYLGWSCLAER